MAQHPRAFGVSAAIPAVFVLLWSSGFVAAKIGLEASGPLTFLALRFALVAVLMLAVVLVMRAPWPASRRELGHLAVLGLTMQALYFGGAWVSMASGVGAGTSALIVSMHPVATALAAGPLLGEAVSRRQWLGLAAGFAGVVLVVEEKLAQGLGTPAGMAWSFVSLAGITAGSFYQKRFCPAMDPRTGPLVQFVAAAAVLAPLALIVEGEPPVWNAAFVAALLYVAVFLSLISMVLLTVMIARGEAARVASLFFLLAPVTAVMGWAVLGETMGATALAGMGLAAAGVALAVWPSRRGGRA